METTVPLPRTRATPLPGIGVRYDFTTVAGQRLSVIAHRDGTRSLNGYRGDDPDACVLSLHFTEQEAGVLAGALAPARHDARPLHGTDLGLVAERIPLPATSWWNGRPLGETRLRTRTGSSIVAVLRGASAIPSPAPGFRLAGGDTLVVIGTREGAGNAAAILAEE
jgi:K+:H+ antiporter subunit KhtT